ncbi:SH3 domain-containing protein [Halovulum sp. GXIMD14793]
MRRHIWSAIAATILLPTSLAAQTLKAPPVDEATLNPAFASYRAQLIQAVDSRDPDGVVAASCPDIKLSFGGASGHAELRKMLADPNNPLWQELQQVLVLGGRFEGTDVFTAPHMWSFELPEQYDPYLTYFVTGTDVLMRNGPSSDAVAIDALSHDVVLVPDYSQDAYLPVTLADGRKGFVSRDFLRSAIDYRAIFTLEGGRWQMCVFIAGD